MALALGIQKGHQFLIDGGHTLTVTDILAVDKVKVTFQGREILVTDQERVLLMECSLNGKTVGVYVQCGKSDKGASTKYTRLAFEAPRAINIERV